MERTKVESSNIKSIGYDGEKTLLEVEFNNGKVYQYHPVPYMLYKMVISAESIGRTFNEKVKSDKSIKYKDMS